MNSRNFKTGIEVIDQIIQGSWEMVEAHVKADEAHEKKFIEFNNKMYSEGVRGYKMMPPFRAWGEREKSFSALMFIGDFTRAMMRVIKASDKLVEAQLRAFTGKMTGDIKIKREGVVYNINTQLISAGGYNIQRYHYRYLIKTDLPKVAKAPAGVDKEIEKETQRLNRIESIDKREIPRIEKRIDDLEEELSGSMLSATKEDAYSNLRERILERVEAGYEPMQEHPETGKQVYATRTKDWSKIEYVYHKSLEQYIKFEQKEHWNYVKERVKRNKKEILEAKKKVAGLKLKKEQLLAVPEIREAIESIEALADISEGAERSQYRAEVRKLKKKLDV